MNKLAPVKTACEEAAMEMVLQPEFAAFFRDLNDARPETALDGPPRRYVYTGNKSQVDDQTRLKIGALRLLGASDREIERQLHIDARSIPAQLRTLEATGQLPALKERLLHLVGDNAERSSLLLTVLLNKGMDGTISIELAAMLKAVGSVNCFQLEKYQLLTGQPTEILEQRVGAGRDEIERWWREQAIPVHAEVLPNDSASTVDASKPQQKALPATPGHEPDTTPPATAGAPDHPSSPWESGGGGLRDAGSDPDTNGSTAL